jgi:hypothetical protein
MIIQRQPSSLELFPVQVFISLALFHHGNTILYRAYQFTQIAPHAFFFFNGIGVVRLAILQVDRLVRGIFAGYITQTAMDAFILVNVGNNMEIDVQVFPMR